jgi:hypothetical protein
LIAVELRIVARTGDGSNIGQLLYAMGKEQRFKFFCGSRRVPHGENLDRFFTSFDPWYRRHTEIPERLLTAGAPQGSKRGSRQS